MTMQNAAKVTTTTISLDDLHPFPDNPNEEDTITFNNLVDEIEQDGFDQPLIVVPAENILGPGADGYVVVSGNHRLKALQTQGQYEAVDCVVKDWDAEKSKIKVIRRNMLGGELNPQKFSKIVDELSNGYTKDQLADALGFRNIEEFDKVYQREKAEDDRKGTEGAADARNEMNLIDGLSLILNRLFSEFGDTVPHSFMFFLYGSKVHLVVQANTKLKRMLEVITRRCVEDKLDVNLVLTGLLGVGVQATNFEKGPPERQAIEDMALEGSSENHDLEPVPPKDGPPDLDSEAGDFDQEGLDAELRSELES